MPDTTISALTDGTTANSTDRLPAARTTDGGITWSNVYVTPGYIKTATIGAGSVSIASGKTFTASNTLTLAGTDSTTMTFPTTSATIARTDAGNTFTGAQTFSVGTVNGTGLDISQTWTGTGTYTGLKYNVGTDSGPANAASLLLDLQVGAVSKFSVTKSGYVKSNGIARENIDTASTVTGLLFQSGSGGWIGFYPNSGSASAVLTNGNIYSLGSGGTLAWASGADPNPASGNTYDLRLTRDAANTLALKNSTNPQIFRAYSTTTGPSYGYFASGVTDAGVATADTLFIGTGGAGAAMTKLALVVNGTSQLNYNIGASGAWYTPGGFTVNGNIQCNGWHIISAVAANGNGGLYFRPVGGSDYAQIQSPALNTLLIGGATAANFSLLQFGGSTSSFPALKRSSATLQVRLADDSGDAAFQCGTATSGGTAFNVNGTGGNSIASVTNTTTGTLLQVLNSSSATLFSVADTPAITLIDAMTIAVGTTTGTKIGTATSQKIGFWNAAPIVQPTTGVAAATVAATGTGDVVAASTTFDGYTIPQIVKAMRNAGLLA